jgi:hypothetical protein
MAGQYFDNTRVDWLVIEHLSTQGRLDLRGELPCF